MLIDLSFILFYSFSVLFIMRKVAKSVGLVDHPSQRKNHDGVIPIAGGISVCIILANILYTRPDLVPNHLLLLLSIVTLTIIGTIDDKFEINVFLRLCVQMLLSLSFIHFSGLEINHLGDLFGFGAIKTTWLSGIITAVAVVGSINAFNMIDGLDGLLGVLSIVTFASLSFLLKFNDQPGLSYFCLIFVITIIPYICMNLGYFGRKRKVFMGDAGSMMIGFLVIWFLLSASKGQGSQAPAIQPANVLWLIAIPLMDMTATIARRIKKGHSPLQSDQEHIHYILQDLGFSPSKTLFIISSLAISFALVGVLAQKTNTSAPYMFYGFLACFFSYSMVLSNLQKRTTNKRAIKCKNKGSSIDRSD